MKTIAAAGRWRLSSTRSAAHMEPLRVGADGDAVETELRRQRCCSRPLAPSAADCCCRGASRHQWRCAHDFAKCWRCGIVADTKSVCRPAPRLSSPPSSARSAPESRSWSSARVRVSARHASTSSTTRRRRLAVGSRRARITESTCSTLPTTTCGGCASSQRRWRLAPEPSSSAITCSRSGLPAASRRATRVTCAASSRVGSSTSACTVACGRSAARSGSTYASVFPDPVSASMIASAPSSRAGCAAA